MSDSDEEVSTEDDCDFTESFAGAKRRHVLEGNGGGGVATSAWNKYIRRLVRKDLEGLGICVQSRNEGRGRSRRPKQVRGRSGRSATRSGGAILTDYKNHASLDNSILVQNLVPVILNDGETQISIPLFLKVSCDFIRQHMDSEGIFRKPGASTRKQRIMQDLLKLTAKDELGNLFKSGDTVYDVCSALTQILRNLQNPIIPNELHAVFLSCFDLEPRKLSITALLESICLLPSANISALSYFIQLLQEVALHSSKNLMVVNNLGVVMVENIMPTISKNDLTDGSKTPTTPSINPKEKIDRHTQVIETLIEHADRVGFLTSRLQERIRENPMSPSDAGSSDEEDGGGENSPRKKRRSSSLNRLLGNIFRKTSKQSKSIEAANLSILKTPLSLSGHTPVIKEGSRRYNSKTDHLNSHKTNQLLLKKSLAFPNVNLTPYSAFRTTPAVSLNPSPKFSANAETPFGPKRKYFASSNLLKKRLRTSPPEPQAGVPGQSGVPVTNKASLETPKPTAMDLVQFEASPRKLQDSKLTKTNSTATGLGKSPRARPHSFNSPRTTPTGNTAITRSPSTRRTLRRGRPNTLRVGLTRPSPTNNVVKIEPSPPTSAPRRLLRSASSTGVVKKESFMFGSGDTSPRKRVTIEPSGRVISRNSRPSLEFLKTAFPEKPNSGNGVSEGVGDGESQIDEKSDKHSHSQAQPSKVDSSSVDTLEHGGTQETQPKTPLTRVNTSLSADSRSPRKIRTPTTRSQSMRDSTRSYIPRPIANNLNKKPSFRDGIEEENISTPTRPQKSMSTSAVTPQQQLKRRNSVQELVKLYESTSMMSRIPSAINQESGRPKPYPYAVRTLDRGKLEPYNRFNSMTRPAAARLQFTKPVWSTLPEQNLTKQQQQ